MEVANNTRQQQFEIMLGDEMAHTVYRIRNSTLYIMHTSVPESMKGQGIGSLLATTALKYAQSNNYQLAVLCPFVAGYVKKHPEWYDLYDRGFHKVLPD